jgi:hypothetical protein
MAGHAAHSPSAIAAVAFSKMLLQAFLQRIINGGGYIQREYGLGRRRTDLFILWRLPNGEQQRIVIETKLLRGSRQATIEQGLEQTQRYMDIVAAQGGHLLLFERSQRPWSEKVFHQEEKFQGVPINV